MLPESVYKVCDTCKYMYVTNLKAFKVTVGNAKVYITERPCKLTVWGALLMWSTTRRYSLLLVEREAEIAGKVNSAEGFSLRRKITLASLKMFVREGNDFSQIILLPTKTVIKFYIERIVLPT